MLCNILILSGSLQMLHAQSNNNMGVGTTTPHASAILDIYSNDKGLLLPRPTAAPVNPEAGLIYYGGGHVNYFDGSDWRSTGLWRLNGNKAYYNADNVGIGTNNPFSKLSISPNTAESKITLWDGGNSTVHLGFGVSNGQLNYDVPTGNAHVFYAGGKNGTGTELMRINGDGFVRTKGGAIINYDNPTIYLQDTDNKSGMIHQNSDLMYFLSGSGANSNTWALNGSYWPLTLNMNSDAATFGGPAYFMEGNVGIGTDMPNQKLHIEGGGIYASGTITAGVEVNASGSITTNQHLYATSGNVYTNLVDATQVDCEVVGNYDAGIFRNNSSSAATVWIKNSNGPWSPGLWINEGSLTVQNGDAEKPGGGFWNSYSDLRLKKDVEDFNEGLGALRKVRPVWFHYNGKNGLSTEPRYVGIIAQELEKVAPYMVSVSRTTENVEKYLSVDPNAFLYMLINSVQELDETVQKQEQIIASQNKKIGAQQAEIDAIKKALEKAGIQLD